MRITQKAALALACLSLAALFSPDSSRYDRLSAAALAKVSGRDIYMAVDVDACSNRSLAAGEVTWTSCITAPNNTFCISCLGVPTNTPIPNTTGPTGLTATTRLITCDTQLKFRGVCKNGLCKLPMQAGSCEGEPADWNNQ